MSPEKSILIAVDPSKEATRAVEYVADIVGKRSDVRIRLFHVLDPLPPELVGFAGSRGMPGKGVLQRERDRWLEAAEKVTKPIFTRAKSILVAAGVPDQVLETQFGISANPDDLASDILDEARENGFGTVVVGRRSFSGLKELFEHHQTDDMVRQGRGLTLWIVE